MNIITCPTCDGEAGYPGYWGEWDECWMCDEEGVIDLEYAFLQWVDQARFDAKNEEWIRAQEVGASDKGDE